MWLDAELREEFHSACGWMRNCARSLNYVEVINVSSAANSDYSGRLFYTTLEEKACFFLSLSMQVCIST